MLKQYMASDNKPEALSSCPTGSRYTIKFMRYVQEEGSQAGSDTE